LNDIAANLLSVFNMTIVHLAYG